MLLSKLYISKDPCGTQTEEKHFLFFPFVSLKNIKYSSQINRKQRLRPQQKHGVSDICELDNYISSCTP